MKIQEFVVEAANPAQQAAIAISMKKAGKKPKNEADIGERFQLPKHLYTKRDRFKSLHKEAVKEEPKFTGHFKGKDTPPVGDRLVGEEKKKSLRNTNPCWKGYHPVGTKKKNGRTVPNCVPESIQVGDSVRTQDMSRHGIVESIEIYRPFNGLTVYFRDSSGTLLRTPATNLIKIFEDRPKLTLTETRRLLESLSSQLKQVDNYHVLALFEAATADVQGKPTASGQQLQAADNSLYTSIRTTLAGVADKVRAMSQRAGDAAEYTFDNSYYSAKEKILSRLPSAAKSMIDGVFGKLEQAAKNNPKLKHPLIIAASTGAALLIPSVGGSAMAIAGIVAVLNLVFGNTPYKSVLTGLSSGALAGVLGWAAHSLPNVANLLPDWAGDIGASMQSATGHKVIKGAELAAHHELEHPGIVSKTIKGVGNTASNAIQGLRNFASQAAQARASGIGR